MILEASVMEWSIAVIGIIGSIGGLLKVSNCRRIKCGITGLECERDTRNDSPVEEDKTVEIKIENDKKKKDDFTTALESKL